MGAYFIIGLHVQITFLYKNIYIIIHNFENLSLNMKHL